MSPVQESQTPLWRERYGAASPAFLTNRTAPPPPPPAPRPTVSPTGWTASAGRAWRRLPTVAQWVIVVGLFFGMQTLTPPAGFFFVVIWVVVMAITQTVAPPAVPVNTKERPWYTEKEVALAASTSLEAQVAGAASQAWQETKGEVAWSSPRLPQVRASFDGNSEVDAIVDVASRIHHARSALGKQPTGPAAAIWRQHVDALDQGRAASR